MKGIYEELGRPKNLICLTDSSAAKGITNRQGVGKVKHLSLRELWLQDAVSKKLLKVQKEDTETNWADFGTKVLEGPRISQLLSMMPLKRGVIAASMLVAVRAQCPNDEDDAGGWMLPFYIHPVDPCPGFDWVGRGSPTDARMEPMQFPDCGSADE